MTDAPPNTVRITGRSSGMPCAAYVYQRTEKEYQCPICMRLLQQLEVIDHTAHEHPKALRGA